MSKRNLIVEDQEDLRGVLCDLPSGSAMRSCWSLAPSIPAMLVIP